MVDASYYTWHSPELFPQTLATLEGDLGTLELLEGYQLRIHTARGCEELDVEPDVPLWGEKPWHGVQESVVELQRHVLDVLRGHATPQPSGADNLKTLALALACYESAVQSRTVPASQGTLAAKPRNVNELSTFCR